MKLTIIQLLPYIAPFIIGWLIKSPLFRSVPADVTEKIGKLDFGKVTQQVIDMIADPTYRVDQIADWLIPAAKRNGVELDKKSAIAVVNGIGKAFAPLVKLAKDRIL